MRLNVCQNALNASLHSTILYRRCQGEILKKNDPAALATGPLISRLWGKNYAAPTVSVSLEADDVGPREISSAITQTEFLGLPSLSW